MLGLFILLVTLSPSSGLTDEAETAFGIAQRPRGSTVVGDDPREAYCESWRLSVEANNAGSWKKVPPRCADLVEAYVSGPQYELDSKVVARYAQAYAKTVELTGDGMDAWIFDVDDTLLSNVQYYTRHTHGYGLHKYPIY
ncbi:hypothetical protein HPP92_006389 [Vanilla planifolia]|uniref:Acid phosphatase n=1 Tax=Vanilla planifolia TaxID=51239 RepID=A0A835RQJ7_VANPL|nr:hypothetical protein HPP92_006389 [Vanilla planifolia]